MSERITVVLVDDHMIVRQGVRTFLELQPDILVIGEAETGTEAVRLAGEYAPDVVLMDLKLPEMDGIEATRRVVETSPRTQGIVLTSYHEDEHIFPATRAGAISCVLKDIRPPELADVVRKAAAGEATLHPHVARRLMQELKGCGGRGLCGVEEARGWGLGRPADREARRPGGKMGADS
jgi:NarL family two-component system response regulator LiaR